MSYFFYNLFLEFINPVSIVALITIFGINRLEKFLKDR